MCHILNGELDSSIVKYNSSLFFTQFASLFLPLPFYSYIMNSVKSGFKSLCVFVCVKFFVYFWSKFYIFNLFYMRDMCCSMLISWPIFMLLQESCVKMILQDLDWLVYCLYYKSDQHNYRREGEHNQIVCNLIQLQASPFRVLYPTSETPHRTRVHCWHEKRPEVRESVVGGISNDEQQQYVSHEKICIFWARLIPILWSVHSYYCFWYWLQVWIVFFLTFWAML
jgi:hypothetical protein